MNYCKALQDKYYKVLKKVNRKHPFYWKLMLIDLINPTIPTSPIKHIKCLCTYTCVHTHTHIYIVIPVTNFVEIRVDCELKEKKKTNKKSKLLPRIPTCSHM